MNPPVSENHPLHDYLKSSAVFLLGAMAHIRNEDANAADVLQASLQAGAMLSLRVDFTPATGHSKIAIDFIEPGGTKFQLLEKSVTQSVSVQ